MNMPLHPVDIVAIIYLLYAAISGLRRGLSGELARMVGAAIILFVAWWLYPGAGDYLQQHTRIEALRVAQFIAFAGLLLAGFVVVLAVRLLLKAILEFKFKGHLERVGGALAGTVRAGVALAALVLIVNLGSRGYLYEQVALNSFTGQVLSRTLMPLYEDLAAEYPDRIPRPSSENIGETVDDWEAVRPHGSDSTRP